VHHRTSGWCNLPGVRLHGNDGGHDRRLDGLCWELRSVWLPWLGLALVIGLGQGAAIAAAADARRTETADPRFVQAQQIGVVDLTPATPVSPTQPSRRADLLVAAARPLPQRGPQQRAGLSLRAPPSGHRPNHAVKVTESSPDSSRPGVVKTIRPCMPTGDGGRPMPGKL
jgi:hypothetical protein